MPLNSPGEVLLCLAPLWPRVYNSFVERQVLFILQAIRNDLQSYVEGSWEEHAQTVEDLLRYQLVKHRLILVSSESGRNFILPFTVQRIQSILEKILFQLVTKASDGKFQTTKSLLMELTHNSKMT